ncbi:MAG: hypothetical protein ISR45_04185 [Rhodospirillales bacterium]|nr:hypothetical protein [Rhodospirillales bacterium]
MKRKTLILSAVAALTLGVAAYAVAPTFAHGNGGYGYPMGHGYGHGMMNSHGNGMMGQGGYGMMGHGGYGMMGGGNGACGQFQQSGVDRNLGVEDIKGIVEKHLAMRGNDRLKIGKVAVVDDDTIIAEIVTVDDSLVRKLEFNTKTGAHRPIK